MSCIRVSTRLGMVPLPGEFKLFHPLKMIFMKGNVVQARTQKKYLGRRELWTQTRAWLCAFMTIFIQQPILPSKISWSDPACLLLTSLTTPLMLFFICHACD